jgi:2,4-dienoyl-CoA reductase-like NADH-dependent reductase (Old Yellow Enzyme family)
VVSPSILFQPSRIASVELKNRIVMAPMTTRCADAEGFVTEEMIEYYVRRAAGGVGLITIEMSSPESTGRHRRFELGICDDKYIPGLRKLVDALHPSGTKVSIQLGHGGGHTRPDISGETPIAPSAIPYEVEEGHTETVIPKAMTVERIRQATKSFADAALRAEKAGFDFVEVHAAHGYLISQFLTPAENRREDEYGGSLENRARFALEITRAIRSAAPSLGIIFRIDGDDYFPGGITIEEAVQVAAWAEQAGADSLSVTGGHYRSLPSGAVMIPPMSMPDATFLHLARAIKDHVTVPVIAVGRLGDPPDAVRALQGGDADFVALGRPLLADAEWVNQVQSDIPVRMCIACNTCVDGMRTGSRLHCRAAGETHRHPGRRTGRPHLRIVGRAGKSGHGV